MTLDEMMNRRDLATHTCMQLRGKLYNGKTGVYNMEDFEKRSFDELEQYAKEQFKIGPYNSLIFSGWVTTKGLAHKYVDFLNCENFKYPVLMLFELRTFIIFDSPETYVDGLKKLGADVIMNSSLNLAGIFFAENGFEKQMLRSIRGFGYEKEDVIYKFKNKNVFSKILELIDSTAGDKSIIEMCGHAMFIGVKK